MDQKTKVQLLHLIEKNSRMESSDLAAMLGVTTKEIEQELKQLEKDHIICGYHTLINWDNTSEDKVTALIELRVTPQRGNGFDKIAERLYQYPEVEALYLMSGAYDFMLMLKESTMKEVAMFVSGKLAVLEEVQSTATHFVLVKYKDHGTPLHAPKKDERMVITP